MRFLRIPVFGVGVDILLIVQSLFDNHIHDRVQHGHIRARLELQHVTGIPLERLPTWIHHDQLATTFGELLEIGRRHRMVFDRVTANRNCHICVFNLVKGGRHGT